MSKMIMFTFLAVILGLGAFTSCTDNTSRTQQKEQETRPQYLYKVISVENWKNSQGKEFVVRAQEDVDFIHLAKEDQVQKTIDKFWFNTPEFVVLKIDTEKLPGNLVFEANPGGTNKYYHLYNTTVPVKAVVESKKVKK